MDRLLGLTSRLTDPGMNQWFPVAVPYVAFRFWRTEVASAPGGEARYRSHEKEALFRHRGAHRRCRRRRMGAGPRGRCPGSCPGRTSPRRPQKCQPLPRSPACRPLPTAPTSTVTPPGASSVLPSRAPWSGIRPQSAVQLRDRDHTVRLESAGRYVPGALGIERHHAPVLNHRPPTDAQLEKVARSIATTRDERPVYVHCVRSFGHATTTAVDLLTSSRHFR